MLTQFKEIPLFVLILFLAAWGLQSLSPVVMQQFSHHDVMMCDKSGDDATCALDNTKECSCSHTSGQKDNKPILCGCSHHGNEPVGTVSPLQIKAPLVSAFDGIIFSPIATFLSLKQYQKFIFPDDIFHPPRLSA